MKYLHILVDSGAMCQTDESPSQNDLDAVDAGELIILTYDSSDGFMSIDEVGDVISIPSAE